MSVVAAHITGRTEATLRYIVEHRWLKAPPAPYSNDWQAMWSFDEKEAAKNAMYDEISMDSGKMEFRVRDRDTDGIITCGAGTATGCNI